MRLKLTLFAVKSYMMPCNYHYPLSAAIYKILSQPSPDYSAFLHDRGYTGPDGKPCKLFTFPLSPKFQFGMEVEGGTLLSFNMAKNNEKFIKNNRSRRNIFFNRYHKCRAAGFFSRTIGGSVPRDISVMVMIQYFVLRH